MSPWFERESAGKSGVGRRAWLLRAASSPAVLAGIAGSATLGRTAQEAKQDPAGVAARELERAETRVRAVTGGSLRSAASEHYQALGDASESFMKIALEDCERIAQEFLDFYRLKGFQVKPPERRMTVVVFRDERPFMEFARRTVRNVPPNVVGFYSRAENYLVLFDARNVPASQRGGALKNMRNLAHEATHQLCFNTGLLNRKGDIPAAVVEGLACYSETRRLRGRSEPGLLNSERLDDLAHIQRRATWISTADLLADDSPAGGGNFDRMQLFYAQSWILIYTLMKSPQRSAEFQAYLKTILPRVDKKNRLADAEKSFGELNHLDQELRQEAIRLQKEPRP
jgi:Protein of unknown function (DUF1570)